MDPNEGHELPVVQTRGEGAPRAVVFTGSARSLTPAEAKRARFVRSLKDNYARLKEAMAFFEHFAVVCELSQERVAAIRRTNQDALDELSRRFNQKLADYDRRIGGNR
jgi:hypothetical protein